MDDEQDDEQEKYDYRNDPDLWYKDRYLTGEETAGPWPCIKVIQ